MNRFTQTLKQVPPLTLSLIAAGVLAVGGLGLVASQSRAADAVKPGATAKPALTVAVAQAKTGSIPIKLSANGNVMAWQEASLGAEANGLRVAELHATIGDRVKRGQLLASFAAESVQADVALARATVAEASANALDASANADRARAVQGTGALSAQQINQYLTAEMAAKARVDSAKAQLDAQQLRLKHTRLESPDDGVISARSATVGTVVGAGTEMFKLIRQGRLEWRGEVTSAEIGRIAAGTAVVVTAPGGAQMQGRVRMVAPTVDTATRNGLVYVDLSGPVTGTVRAAASVGASFKPGMFARGEFALGNSGGLTVVNTAIVVRDGFSYVYRIGTDHRVTQVKVQTGRTLGDQVELLGGVSPADKLVASGASFLSEGDLVKVVDSKANVPAAPADTAPAATK